MVREMRFLNKYALLTAVLFIIVGVILERFDVLCIVSNLIYKTPVLVNESEEKLYTETELAKYNGQTKEPLYLSILGSVFDVSVGKKYYEMGGSYHYFVGKDGSRSFITGNFADESEDRDDVIGLSCTELISLLGWVDTYKDRYTYKGKLIGRYYDAHGKESNYKKMLNEKIKECESEKQLQDNLKLQYPPCNMEWSTETGSRVWCSENSGGIRRNWVGVPRQLYMPGENSPKCVCVDLNNKETNKARLKAYHKCSHTSTSCTVVD